MKLAPLLAQFLYSNHRLDLEGIGSFYLDSSLVTTNDNRQQTTSHSDGISFENNPGVRESAELSSFISSQTGKMKALASADLSSHIALAQQFLNIGKPFLLEGIGSLVKIRSGKFEFTAGALLAEKLKEPTVRNNNGTGNEDSSTYEPFLEKEKTRTAFNKPVIALLVVVGIGLAVLGGYSIYKRNSSAKLPSANANKVAAAALVADTSTQLTRNEVVAPAPVTKNDGHKYILETANSKRAFTRYNALKEYGWKVQMETSDSVRYKLFLLLPTASTDTSRVLDSLTALNGRKVYIEN